MNAPVLHKRADRMKHYEDQHRHVLPPKQYTIIRVDGRAFHTLTRNMERPFDSFFIEAMDAAAIALCNEIQGAQFGYTQSDEISVLLTDFGSMQEHWFGGVVQKMCSIAAVAASNAFNARIPAIAVRHMAQFDARVFTVPDRAEAINYFLWRQADCHRNAVSMIAEANFSSKQLLGRPVPERIDMLAKKGVLVDAFPLGARLGRTVVKETFEGPVTFTRKDTGVEHTEIAIRSRWVVADAGWFDWDGRGFLESRTPDRVS